MPRKAKVGNRDVSMLARVSIQGPLNKPGAVGKKKQRDVQDNEGGQPRREIPLGRLMVGDAHPDDTAKGPSRERKTKQSGFGEPAATVNRPLLVQAENGERDDVDGEKVYTESDDDGRVKRSARFQIDDDDAGPNEHDKHPHNQEDYGTEPPGNVVLVHVVPGEEHKGKEHPQGAACYGEQGQDPAVHEAGILVLVVTDYRVVDRKENEREGVNDHKIDNEGMNALDGTAQGR